MSVWVDMYTVLILDSINGIFRILANHVSPQNFVASLYGKFRAEKLLYKEVTEL